ncbi:MAG: DUF883 family protein [Verrucomicrobiales bacterium]|nr:DUF883 family protein [Verrucomicrobiales bacterium]
MESHFDPIERANNSTAGDRVLTDLRTLARDAEELLKATASDVSEKAKEARARLNAALERAKTTCVDLQERTVATAKAAANQADSVVRAHPYESIGVAFGVGVLIGVLVGRK